MVKDSSITSSDKAWSFRVKSGHWSLVTGHWTLDTGQQVPFVLRLMIVLRSN